MQRYSGRSDPGCANVVALAEKFLAGLHIWDDEPEADGFFAESLTLEAFAADQLSQWLVHYSGNLLAGGLGLADSPQYRLRQKTPPPSPAAAAAAAAG